MLDKIITKNEKAKLITLFKRFNIDEINDLEKIDKELNINTRIKDINNINLFLDCFKKISFNNNIDLIHIYFDNDYPYNEDGIIYRNIHRDKYNGTIIEYIL